MTIREHFRRRFNLIKNGLLAATFVMVGVLTWLYPHHSRLQVFIGGLILAILSLPIVSWAFRGRFICPRCGTDLPKLQAAQLRQARRERGWLNVDRQVLWDAWDNCPRCGVSFDDPYP
jgi:hypothetical protein